MLDIIKKDLADAGITIDNWASEKSYYGELDSTLKRLEKSGEVYKKDDTTYIDVNQNVYDQVSQGNFITISTYRGLLYVKYHKVELN